jgi:hypothetical protein
MVEVPVEVHPLPPLLHHEPCRLRSAPPLVPSDGFCEKLNHDFIPF